VVAPERGKPRESEGRHAPFNPGKVFENMIRTWKVDRAPNGMRLSCGRKPRGRTSAPPAEALGGGTNAILPYSGAPASSKRGLDGSARVAHSRVM
jgi:hypothetical protein